MGQNEETLPTHPARSETKKVTDKEPTSNRPDPVRNTCTWMKTTSYGKTKQHLFVGLLLGLLLLSTQAQAESIICCEVHNAKCLSCAEGLSEEEYCKRNPSTRGCENYNCCKAFTAKCEACVAGMSEKEYCKQVGTDFLGPLQGCEKYNCCRANNAKCLSCAAGLSEEEYCKKNPSTSGCEKYNCCKAFTADCQSCAAGLSEEEYCKNAPTDFFGAVQGCEKYHNGYKPSPCCLSGHCNEKACNGLTYEEGGRGDFSAKCISCDLGISVEEFCRTKQPEGKTMEGCEEFCKKKKNRDVPGCEKYHKGDGGKGCCNANTAECLACSEGKSVEKFCKKKKNRDVPGCEKKGCCKANTADCLACSKGKSVKKFCKKYKNRDVPGCEKYHRRGSLGEKDRDDSRQQEDRDDSRQQEDGGFFRWLLQQLFGG